MGADRPGRGGLAGRLGVEASLGAQQLERSPLEWSGAYLRARELEGRLYPDVMVATLPDVPDSDPLAAEWRIRAGSAARLMAHLARLPRPLEVLEVGCGNGWLADRIARIEGCRVVGVDANERELAQARRVFGGRPGLDFVLADITLATQPIGDPTVIVLASVAQYVRDLPDLIRRLRSWLPPTGELHILDTPFYTSAELPDAADRSRRHYAALGVPEMAAVYRHHEWSVLAEFAPEVLHRPDSLRARAARRLGRPRSPFPWIRIRGLPPRDAGA